MKHGYITIARRIPQSVRTNKLLTTVDPIRNAQPSAGDKHLRLLFIIWSEFVEPMREEDLGCPKCVHRLLSNFRELKPTLVKLEGEYQLMKALRTKYNERTKQRSTATTKG